VKTPKKMDGSFRYTLQGINISQFGKRKIIFKMPFLGDMLVSWRIISSWGLLGPINGG